MHMMFVDESGDPGFPADGNWANFGGSRLYVRLGAVIHGHKWRAWNERLHHFKRNRGLSWDVEVRATDIRRGGRGFAGWDQGRRDFFMNELTQLVGANPDVTLIGVVIDKALVDRSRKDRLVKPEVRSLEILLERYNLFLDGQKDRSGIVVLDPTAETNDDNLRYFQSFLLAQSDRLRPLHIVEGTFFAKSHTSNMIQIADVCANVLYREMAHGGNCPEYRAIYARFWRKGTRLAGYGLNKWPEAG